MSPNELVEQLIERLEGAQRLDPAAERVQQGLGQLLRPGPLKDFLSGTWLGHPLHPLLVTAPIGSWVNAALLDVVGGRRGRAAADLLVAFGLLAAVPTAAAGASDWLDTTGNARRVGFVHALGNVTVLVLMAASLRARLRGRRVTGVLFGLAGNAVVGGTGYLGGHLAYRQGVGVNPTAFEKAPSDWTAVAESADLRDGVPILVTVDDLPLMIVRDGERIHALADRCTHRGGPLHEGDVYDHCVECPWHGSVFALEDGRVVKGPATHPQPTYATRVSGGKVEVRRRDVTASADDS